MNPGPSSALSDPTTRTDVRHAFLRSRKSVEEGLVSEAEYLDALAERVDTFVLPAAPPPYLEPVTDAIPASFMEEFLLVPLFRDARGAVWIAQARDLDWGTHRELQQVLGGRPQFVAAPKAMVLDLIAGLYGRGDDTGSNGRDPATPVESGLAITRDVEELAHQPPVIRLVNFIIHEAFRKRASDVHVEAMEGEFKIRYRIDGRLHDVTQPPKEYQAAVVSRIKIMAELDINERRRPQDGRVRMTVEGRPIDLRISTVPTLHGESVVMRILDRQAIALSLEELGFSAEMLTQFGRAIAVPHGIVLVTGPTGSGKTTTLYAALQKLNRPDVKILTVEDPVEYQLEGINQVPVHPRIGLTFAKALRSLLRQDPDIMMVGEMRDRETAAIAIEAALTGHLVFSTLHTNDAPSGVTRLLEMGVEEYLVASTVTAIVAQRLVRMICPQCARDERPEALLGTPRDLLANHVGPVTFRRGRGCETCAGTGYRGRSGLFELLTVDDRIRGAILERAPAHEIGRLARKAGMRALREDGIAKAARGVTTLDEVLRVTQDDETGEAAS